LPVLLMVIVILSEWGRSVKLMSATLR
jgi:hypothetical protein